MQKTPSSKSFKSTSVKSASSSTNSQEIKQYVQEFKKEVDSKYKKSKTNLNFVFPRKTEKSRSRKNLNDSLESLKQVTFYDLDSQNIKATLLRSMRSPKKSETTLLVDVITKLGKLDPRYLASQMQNCDSTFFRILFESVQKKAAKDPRSKDSLQSCSVKTKQIFAPMLKPERPPLKSTQASCSFGKQTLPCDLTARLPQNKLRTLELFAGLSPNRTRLGQESVLKSKNASLSPRSQKSRVGCSLKPLKSEKLLNKPPIQILRSNLLKTSFQNSSSRVKLQLNKHQNSAVFQAVKANFVNQKIGLNKSKSKNKTPREVLESKPQMLKNQISLTKEQLRNLIQKNIYKGGQIEASVVMGGKVDSQEDKKKNVVMSLSSLRSRIGNF